MTTTLTRPDGRTYRPRNADKFRVKAWGGDDPCGVIVFGTLDPAIARPVAAMWCAHWYESDAVTDPQPGWYRDGYEWGRRTWVLDERRGAPGVAFTWDADAPPARTDTEETP